MDSIQSSSTLLFHGATSLNKALQFLFLLKFHFFLSRLERKKQNESFLSALSLIPISGQEEGKRQISSDYFCYEKRHYSIVFTHKALQVPAKCLSSLFPFLSGSHI